ncbi:MAG: hypothetical protein JWO86_2909 [Myxococcaceae bacterium]|nr:hypothetical protein [Myxococcaceae bacterium]
MSLKTVFSMLALTVVGSISVAACAAPTDDTVTPEEAAAESQDAELRMASYNSCNVDDDCVAVPKGGCCPNGINVAVNESKTAQYAKAAKCKSPPQFCPLSIILDQRVAQCNSGTKKCEMVKAEDIKCGGFIAHAHQCPTDYSCTHTGPMHPDLPGKCTKDVTPPPPPPPADCTTTGCPSGKYCSACWGHMACIPNGALC